MKIVWLAILYFNYSGSSMVTVEVATREDCIRVIKTHESVDVHGRLVGKCVQVRKP